jgi:hypothetical protein
MARSTSEEYDAFEDGLRMQVCWKRDYSGSIRDQRTAKDRMEVQGYWKEIKHLIVMIQASDIVFDQS